MTASREIPYGAWPSPVAAADVAAAGVKLREVAFDGADLAWLEGRPGEGGRNVPVRTRGGEREDLLPEPYDVRSAVHEYGGGAWTLADGVLWFVHAGDQCLYKRDQEGAIERVTAPGTKRFYADLQWDAARRRIVAVCEDHAAEAEPRASVVAIDPSGDVTTLAEGRDFHASPRLSPDGAALVWLAWDHPDMPWDGTELWRAELDDGGRPRAPRRLAGGLGESLFQPQFAPDGALYVVSDAVDGWWNLCRVGDEGVVAVTRERAEFGQPQWVFGQSTYAFDAEGGLYAAYTRDGTWHLSAVDRATGALSAIELPLSHIEQLRAGPDGLAFLGGDPATPVSVHTLALASQRLDIVRSGGPGLDPEYLSRPEPLSYPTAGGETAHALLYAPRNHDCEGPRGERPPLLIKCHGGPTGATSTVLDPRIQFWTSRGFAVLDVNYRGSTGYGREYRRRLYGAWGMADVEDCANGARFLADRGDIDVDRVLISGSSAGGYSVLCVLTFTDLCAAGASYYGIADLERLLDSTHKFESRYLGRLIGDDRELLRARSPLYHADQLTCPVLFLQGGKDKVVPPDQATAMAAALRERGVTHALVEFPEERHGFKDAANIRTALETELAFYAQVLGFEPADELTAAEVSPHGG